MRIRPGFWHGRLVGARLDGALSASGTAQVDTGTIIGTVKDESGGVLPGATVTITHEGQGLTLTSVTREDGTYIFTPIRTGRLLGRSRVSRDSRRASDAASPSASRNTVRVDFTLQAGVVQ